MGEIKRKRGRKPKNSKAKAKAEALDFSPATTATTTSGPMAIDDVFSVGNVELMDPASTSKHHQNRRGRPKKLSKHMENPDKFLQLSPSRRGPRGLENGEFHASVDVLPPSIVSERAQPEFPGIARVVPAMDAVVKVFCVHTEPNFSLPWQRKRQYSSSSSGFVIGGRRVLTNAHSVEHHTQVKLKKRGSDTKYLATVLAIGTECDIGNEIRCP